MLFNSATIGESADGTGNCSPDMVVPHLNCFNTMNIAFSGPATVNLVGGFCFTSNGINVYDNGVLSSSDNDLLKPA